MIANNITKETEREKNIYPSSDEKQKPFYQNV